LVLVGRHIERRYRHIKSVFDRVRREAQMLAAVDNLKRIMETK